jgi:predicted aconitase/predicted aconitase with swiveling domain
MSAISLNHEQEAMLSGRRGQAKEMAMRLLLDLAATAGATELVAVAGAHLSGVSPLTGGLGLRQFLARLATDESAQVAVPTTLNAAGCDQEQFEAMHIAVPEFLAHQREIIRLYAQLGVQTIQSCVPYEWDGVVTEGTAAWAESNAICYGNSYCGLLTNRESALSALASALTGYTPRYGLLTAAARLPNLEVIVSCELDDPTDFSILGDWIGKQRDPNWRFPYGPIPHIKGLPADQLNHEQRKALTAAAANYGSPLVYIEGLGDPPAETPYQGTLRFTDDELARRYQELRPGTAVSLVVLGCPQASLGELQAIARRLRGRQVTAAPDDDSGLAPLWVFTSAATKAIAERTGLAEIIRTGGALLLANTCPEVVPYDQRWVRHVLTNSMKAEHYIKSGLNGIPTSVMRLEDCIRVASGEWRVANSGSLPGPEPPGGGKGLPGKAGLPRKAGLPGMAGLPRKAGLPGKTPDAPSPPLVRATGDFVSQGRGLPSQGDFTVRGQAFVTDEPITFLGFVNRQTGVIEEPGHPADGQSLAGKIAIFPKGSGSTVAPYVLLELFYRGKAPLAIVNSDIDQQSAPACSLEGIPYAYGFGADVVHGISHGATVELKREGEVVTIRSFAET